jgi:hypothetical protein
MDNVVTYDTVVRVDNSELLLKPGMTAEVFIITREVQDAVRVRNSALRARLPDQLRPPIERPPGIPEKTRVPCFSTPNQERSNRVGSPPVSPTDSTPRSSSGRSLATTS